jgi:integration host factor subunit beta
MHTVTKKEMVDRIADQTKTKRVVVKQIVQCFLDEIIVELGQGNRLEFRDFGVFETKMRAARTAQNPKTLARVQVPPKRTVKFKVGRLMKIELQKGMDAAAAAAAAPAEAAPPAPQGEFTPAAPEPAAAPQIESPSEPPSEPSY